jgi:hypothetical protein
MSENKLKSCRSFAISNSIGKLYFLSGRDISKRASISVTHGLTQKTKVLSFSISDNLLFGNISIDIESE